MTLADSPIHRRRWMTLVALSLGAGLAGALVGALLTHVVPVHRGAGFATALGRLWPFGLGLALMAQGLLVALLGTSRRRAGHMVDPGDPREASLTQLRYYRNRAAMLLLGGGALLVPASLSAWSGLKALEAWVPLVLMVALLLGAGWTGRCMWRAADEFTRRLLAGSALWALLLSLGLLLVWQVAVQLALVPQVGAWSATGMMIVLFLVVDSARSMRHGYFF